MRVSWIRTTHRCLGLVIGVQLLLWTVSGFYFSWHTIEQVRGEHLTAGPRGLALTDTTFLSPGVVIAALTRHVPDIEGIEHVALRSLLGEPVYEIMYYVKGDVRYALANACTGVFRSPISRDEAVAIARADFAPDAPVLAVEFIGAVGEDSEYRGRELPAYRVVFDHPSGTRVYVAAERGLVTARRNNTWRVFDFLWMFHIMDYKARDDINNMILRLMSILGVVTVLSGFLLWGVTSRVLRRGTRRAGLRRSGSNEPPATSA